MVDHEVAAGMEVLDVHLLRSVFEHVHRADVARLRAVCHGWKQLIDDSQVMRVLCSS